MKNNSCELLSPAGNLDKLKTAISYGADAVYLGGQTYNLRAASENFNREELRSAFQLLHRKNKKGFVVINNFFHDEDFVGLDDFLDFLTLIKVDGVITSDLGVVCKVKERSNIAIHLSTQASCTNTSSALFWKELGVKRIILGRETSIDEAVLIKKKTGLEVELFIHGSMCMAYSGNCTISNFTQGRDSNRGGCSHSCRFEYSLEPISFDMAQKTATLLSSKDLCSVSVIKQCIEKGIDSLKIEGRMKSPLYVGTVTRVYRQMIDHIYRKQEISFDLQKNWEDELDKLSHREYFLGNHLAKADAKSIYNKREELERAYQVAGSLIAVDQKNAFLQVKRTFPIGVQLEILSFEGAILKIDCDKYYDLEGRVVENIKPNTIVKIPYRSSMQSQNIVRYKQR